MGREINIGRGIRALCRTHGTDAAIAALAERQHGAVGRPQLLSLGLSRDAIQRRVKGGWLHRMWPGVYAVGHRRLSERGRWMAAVLAGGGGAVLMGSSAAALHGFAPETAGEIHVRADRRDRGALRFHRTSLSKKEVTKRHGIPTTTAARTLLDLATAVRPAKLERALREALFKRAVNTPALCRLLLAHSGERGAGALAAALDKTRDAPGLYRSNGEQRFAAWLRRKKLPLPNFNAELLGIEVDCHWPAHHLVAEIDHRSTHARRKDFETDRIRDGALQAHGLRVIRISEPYDDGLEDDLRRLLG